MKIQLLSHYLAANNMIPLRSTEHAAGFDLFMPESGQVAGTAQKIGLGFASEIPEGWMALLLPRSGVGFKHGLEVNNTVGVIDADYRGEWFASMRTKSGIAFSWAAGERVLQAVLVPRYLGEIELVASVAKSERGAGGLGSTGA
jgi:dUTP pyrophosphatase